MENNEVQRRSGSTRRTFLSASAVTAVAAPIVAQSGTASAVPAAGAASAAGTATAHSSQTAFDPNLRALLAQIDPSRIRATIQRLSDFGTRHTASSQTDPNRGIGAATAWVTQQMQSYAAASGGRMTVQQQTFVQPVSNRIPVPTTITNVIATLPGTASPERFYVVTGHLDSRCTDVLDFTSDAPGAEDEQGLYGSSHLAQQMNAAGNDVQAMFSNDIVGASRAFDGTSPDPFTLRLFVEGVPTAATANQIALMQAVGGENDSSSRQLGRFVQEVAPFNLTNMNVRVIWRRDRYLRASDHVSFQTLGSPAARFTEPRENFNHEHQNVQVVNGVQFGDLIDFVDFDYVARVARVNAATVWALATAPGTPKNLQIHTTPPGTLSGTNLTTLTWNATPESNLARYEVVMRETTAADWTDTIDVGNVTTVTLDISKDNVQFGLRAVDTAGNRSPVAFPAVAASLPE